MRISKRLISLALVSILVLALVPIVMPTVSAAPKTIEQIKATYQPYPGNPVSTAAALKTALQQVDPGQYIEINANITLPDTLDFTGNISIAIIGDGVITRSISLDAGVNKRHLRVNAPGLTTITFAGIEFIGKGNQSGGGQLGGGIITNNDLTLDGLVLKNCRAESNGGAIFDAIGTKTITLANSTLEYNHTGAYNAVHGGAIYAGTVSITDSTLSNNMTTTANSLGGAVYAISSLSLNNVTMENNTATSGAAAYCERNITAAGSRFNSNTATANGGGLCSRDGSVTVTGASVFNGNKAKDGGAICAATAVTVSGATTISNNMAGTASGMGNPGVVGNGGGIHAGTTVTLNNGVTVANNTATNFGGGIYAPNGTASVVTGAKVQKNTAKAGGGIWASVAAIGGEISENKAIDTEGGGIYATGNVGVNTGSLITKNDAKTLGGGIYSSATVTVDAGTVSQNTATTGGAGIQTVIAQVNGGTITQNKTPGDGGGIRTQSGIITVAGGEISSNEAANGGGVWTRNNNVIGTGGKIINNKASGNGAGLYGNSNFVEMDISGTEVAGNIATGNGGGIYMLDGTVKVGGTAKINNNTAANGGGLYGTGIATIQFNEGEIKGNTAKQDGGGVWMDTLLTFTMEDGAEFGNNKSKQGYYWDLTKATTYGEKDYYGFHKDKIKGTVFTSPYNNAYSNDDMKFQTMPRIEYMANGGTGSMPFHVWVWDKKATIADCDFIAPQGKEFVRWDTYPRGTGDRYSEGQVIDCKVSGVMVLYAIWKGDSSDASTSGGGGGGGGGEPKKPDENVTAPLTVIGVADGKTIYENITIEKIGSLIVVAPKLLGYEVKGGGSESVQIKDQANYLTFEYTQFADVTLELKTHDKYVNGYPDGTFKPDDTITRGEAAAIFYRLVSNEDKNDVGAARFSDVNDSDWYGPAVNYLAKNGIINGYSDGTFKPTQTITRAEFAAIATRFDKVSDTGMNAFTDVPYSHWSMEFVNTAADKGWVTGFPGGLFKPDDVVTRAQVVAVVNRMLDRKIDAADVPATAEQYNDVPESYWAYADIMEAATAHESNSRKANGSEIWNK